LRKVANKQTDNDDHISCLAEIKTNKHDCYDGIISSKHVQHKVN